MQEQSIQNTAAMCVCGPISLALQFFSWSILGTEQEMGYVLWHGHQMFLRQWEASSLSTKLSSPPTKIAGSRENRKEEWLVCVPLPKPWGIYPRDAQL